MEREISVYFENRFELGTIRTPELNSKVLNEPKCGRAEGTPIGFRLILQMNSENLARSRAMFFRQGGGSKSEARNLLCPKIQKEFCDFFKSSIMKMLQLIY